MDLSVVFVERRDPESPSIERVFRTVGNILSGWGIQVQFKKLSYGNSIKSLISNIFAPRPPQADVYHVTGHIHYYALLLPLKKTVLTIHDLQVLKVRKGFRRYLVKKVFYDLPVRKLHYITAISEQTKSELIELTACPPEKIIVIENPLTIAFDRHERPFYRNRPTILHIGTAGHKNLLNLIRAVNNITCRLTIIGVLDSSIRQILDQNNVSFENRYNLSENEMRNEYKNSDIVSFCTIAEGFGLPIIEAQAMCVPLITSNLSPMKEVAGEGAVLVDPLDPRSIGDGITKLINDDNVRREVVKKGVKNVKRFSPERIAGQYRDLYKTIIEHNIHN
jgi:glycosyltransferase involved in cell wall biosynthesis